MVATMAHSAEIKVLSTQATEEAYRELVPQFEKASGHKVTTTFTGTLDANKRLAAGETYDLLIMSAPSIDEHIKTGRVVSAISAALPIEFQRSRPTLRRRAYLRPGVARGGTNSARC